MEQYWTDAKCDAREAMCRGEGRDPLLCEGGAKACKWEGYLGLGGGGRRRRSRTRRRTRHRRGRSRKGRSRRYRKRGGNKTHYSGADGRARPGEWVSKQGNIDAPGTYAYMPARRLLTNMHGGSNCTELQGGSAHRRKKSKSKKKRDSKFHYGSYY